MWEVFEDRSRQAVLESAASHLCYLVLRQGETDVVPSLPLPDVLAAKVFPTSDIQ